MADDQPTPAPATLSVGDAYSNAGATPIAPSETTIPLDRAYKHAGASLGGTKVKQKPTLDPAIAHEQNRWMASEQFTVPDIERHKPNLIGEAKFIDAGDKVHYEDEKGVLTEANYKNHVVLRDPEDGKLKVFKRSEDTDYGPITGRLFGLAVPLGEALHTSSVIGLGKNVAQRALAAASRLKEDTGVAVPISKAQVATGTPDLATKVISHLPGGKGPMEKAAGATQQAMSQAATATAELPTGGVATSVEDAGATARSSIGQYIDLKGGTLAKKVDKAYDKVDSFITNQAATHQLPETTATASKLQREYEAMGKTDPKDYNPAISEVLAAVTDPNGLTYAGLKRLRSAVGAEINQGIHTSIVNGDMKQLYGSLTEDMKSLIQSQGGQAALRAWNKAGKEAKAASLQREKLAYVLGSSNRSDEGIFASIQRLAGSTSTADAKALALARKAMGAADWREIASASIARLGRVASGNEQSFSIDKFMRDYGRMSPAGKNILFGESTAHRRALDSIVEISESWPKMAERATPSGEVSHTFGMFGVFHKPLEFMGAVFGINRISTMLAKPATAESVARWMEGYKLVTLKPTRANVTVFNQATRAVAGDVARDEESDTFKATALAKKYAAKALEISGIKDMWNERLKRITQ